MRRACPNVRTGVLGFCQILSSEDTRRIDVKRSDVHGEHAQNACVPIYGSYAISIRASSMQEGPEMNDEREAGRREECFQIMEEKLEEKLDYFLSGET